MSKTKVALLGAGFIADIHLLMHAEELCFVPKYERVRWLGGK
ncbi:MAG TPA: hypothetical protein VMS21_14500 [Methylomirabilota bacterium]|nr:hypothetical protein [Methylomirabilota bacterium]